MATVSKFYSQEVSKHYKPFSQEEEEELIMQYQSSQDPKILDRIVKSMLALVIKLARRYASAHNVSIDDLIQEGNFALIQAASRYRLDKNSRWSTYAFYWVKKGMVDYIRKHSGLVYLPRMKVKEINDYLTNGTPSSDPNFSQYYQLYQVGSLQHVVETKDDEVTLENVIPSSDETPEEKLVRQEQKKSFHQVLKSHLTQSEYDLLLKVVLKELTFREIAEARKVSPQRVRQIYLNIMKKLQKVKLQLCEILETA